MIPEIEFVHPHVFWAMTILPIVALLAIAAERSRRLALDRLLAPRLQLRLAGSASIGRRRLAHLLLLVGLAFCITAIARPRWGTVKEKQISRGSDLIIAVDTSRSMLAQDLPPNRLDRTRLAVLDLLGEVGGARVGLIAFAGESFLQAPLTPDRDAVAEAVRELDTESIGQGGSNIAAAIGAAEDAFGKGESSERALIIFSDGEELEANALVAAERCREKFRIYTIGVGTEAGAPVIRPTRYGNEYVKDAEGNVVTSKLDESRLREVAKKGGGFYIRLQNGPTDMRQLAKTGLATMSEKESENEMKEVPRERYQWPLLAGLVCLATSILLGERRRVLKVAAAAAMLLCTTSPAPAESGFRTTLNRIFDSETPAVAPLDTKGELQRVEAQRERRPGVPEIDFNVGCAAYSTGDYEKAVASFSTALGSAGGDMKARAAHNLGNALARRGVGREPAPKLADWNHAVKQYDTVLALEPENEQARKNREAVLRAIEDLNKKEEEKKKQEEEKKKQEQEKQKQDMDSKGDDKEKQGKPEDENKEQQDGKGNESQQKPKDEGKSGKPEDGNNEEQKPDSNPGEAPKPGDEKPGEAPKPEEGKEGDKPKEGDLREAGQPKEPKDPAKQGKPGEPGQPGGDPQQSEAAEAAEAAREGRMTEKDAKALIEAARKNERVLPPLRQVLDRQRVRTAPNGKDW